MSPLLIKISKDFATLFTTINPIATLALFAGLTASLSRADRHWTALRACIYATIILVVAMTAGQVILDAIGIHMHSLKVAGGIILFLFGPQGASVLVRVMGLILCSLAVEIVLTALGVGPWTAAPR